MNELYRMRRELLSLEGRVAQCQHSNKSYQLDVEECSFKLGNHQPSRLRACSGCRFCNLWGARENSLTELKERTEKDLEHVCGLIEVLNPQLEHTSDKGEMLLQG